MVQITNRNVNAILKRKGLSRFKVSSAGTKEMTLNEKRKIIRFTEKWVKAFKKEGKIIGKNKVLFRGKKYTKRGTLL